MVDVNLRIESGGIANSFDSVSVMTITKHVCIRLCVHAFVRACVRACVRVCV